MQGRSQSQQLPSSHALSKNFLFKQHVKDRQHFLPLTTIHLQSSSYNRFGDYRQLVTVIQQFNSRLEQWRNGGSEVENLVVRYHVMENLSKRMMGLRLMRDEPAVIQEIANIRKWYETVTVGSQDRQMGNIGNVLQAIKSYKMAGPIIDDKDNVQMYQQMARTQHSEFNPPKERLRTFKRKQLITPSTQVDTMMTTKQTFFSDHPPTFQIKVNRTSQPLIINESAVRVETQRKIMPQTTQTTLASGQKDQLETQQQSPEDQLQFRQQQQEQPQPSQPQQPQSTDLYKKPYISDRISKQPQQRPKLRSMDPPSYPSQKRILLTQYQQYTQTLQTQKDLNQVQKWRNLKSRHATELARRSEVMQQGNRYKMCSYQPSPKGVVVEEEKWVEVRKKNKSQKALRRNMLLDQSDQEGRRKRRLTDNAGDHNRQYQSQTRATLSSTQDIRKVDKGKIGKLIEAAFPFPSDVTHPLSFLQKAKQIQNQIRQTRLARTIKTHSKYIRHTSQSSQRKSEQQQPHQVSAFRQPSLTACQRNRSSSFGQILYRFHPETYNLQNHQIAEQIKAALTSKGIPISVKTLGNSLRIPVEPQYSCSDNLYKNGDRLISNPWFPKNIGKKKKKKK